MGTDAVRWHVIEKNPPINGVHSYDRDSLDEVMRLVAEKGFDLEVSVRLTSDWAVITTISSELLYQFLKSFDIFVFTHNVHYISAFHHVVCAG